MDILHVVGARPNLMKAAPVIRAMSRLSKFKQRLVHTGQHYDASMSDVFFQQLDIPAPDINLGVGSKPHTLQTAEIMVRFEEVVLAHPPDFVIVYGDVNSTLAVSLVCSKSLIPVAHVEAGLRSYDRTMPEEINRIVTDHISEILFAPSQDGIDNLLREGINSHQIHLVGNVMVDTLIQALGQIASMKFNNLPPSYGMVTLHRPSNVDSKAILSTIIGALLDISKQIPIVFPIHPRTRKMLNEFHIDIPVGLPLQLWEPIGYLESLSLQKGAKFVITDSGGIQEETTFLGIPCLTVRDNTERPITLTCGTNILVGTDMLRLKTEVDNILAGRSKMGQIPPLWDGNASERIAHIMLDMS